MFWTDFVINLLLVAYVLNCLFMGLVIMMQRSKQEGLGAAFGGGFTESVWGAQTSQVLVKATVWATILFFVLSISLARLYSHRTALSAEITPVQQQLLKPVAPATKPGNPTNATVTPAAPAISPASATPAAPTPVPASAATAKPAPASSK